jgi:hypothetical protein
LVLAVITQRNQRPDLREPQVIFQQLLLSAQVGGRAVLQLEALEGQELHQPRLSVTQAATAETLVVRGPAAAAAALRAILV